MPRSAHTMKSILLTLAALFVAAQTGHAARPLPNTTSQLLVWADQLATEGAAQDQFVAENFVGSQKLTKDRIDSIRAYNPNFLVLQYHKAYGVDIGGNITDANTWSDDIATMRAYIAAYPGAGAEEDYYLHWTTTNDPAHRIEHYWAGNLEYHLADIRHAGFRAYLVEETLHRNEVVGFDGTFFDVAYFPWYDYEPDYDTGRGMGGDGTMWFGYEPWLNAGWSADVWENADEWNSMATPYWQYIAAAYHDGEADALAIANVDRMVTGWYVPEYLDYIDGGMSEGFMTDSGEANNRLVGGDWELSASRILRYLTGNGRILIAQPNYDDTSNTALRRWWVANYFLLKNSTSYYYYAATDQSVAWWPEYDINLGAYSAVPTQELSALLVPGTDSLYQREYANGLVLVNPGDAAQAYTLEGNYCQYGFSGGGVMVGATKPAMSLSCTGTLSGEISVAAHDALLLKKKTFRVLPAILLLLL
ncbi:MAG: putative glycoside hydrolase [Candidatus Electrothrix sp. GW3-4]|uniref:putative glycoside hydrolase n=1 Tax=Candidatus Electrothrix sp. GW3-4 TaxID=3126740 RepID=UPI0030D5CF38